MPCLVALAIVGMIATTSGCKRKKPLPVARHLPPSGDTFVYFARPTKADSALFSASASASASGAGTEPRRVCEEKFDFWAKDPMFSPDGTRIAFSDDTHLYVMNPDCTQRRTLVERGYPVSSFAGATWSPDGKSIAWLERDPDNSKSDQKGPSRYHLMLVPTDGGARRDLGAVGSATGPAFSPDSQTLVFTTTLRDPVFGDGTLPYELVAMRIGDGKRRTLKKTKEELHDVAVSVDGLVAYATTITEEGKDLERPTRHDAIGLTDLDGSGDRVLIGTKDKAFQDRAGYSLYRPRFSPEGVRIAFEVGLHETVVMTLEGKVASSLEGWCFRFSRDGRVLATFAPWTGEGPIRTALAGGPGVSVVKVATSCPSFAP